MDANEIDLDDLDKSDISSDWDSSVDEAPVMEVVESRGEQDLQEERIVAEEQLKEMQSDDEPDGIPRRFSQFGVMDRHEARDRAGRFESGGDHGGFGYKRGSDPFGVCFTCFGGQLRYRCGR